MKYPNGALRITRTPGRQGLRNCVNLEDLVATKELTSACVYSFFIGQEELFRHLPLPSSVPIYIGRDINMDPLNPKQGFKLNKAETQQITFDMNRVYKARYGNNYNAFYGWCGGSSHTKLMLLVYKGFMRIVITSCNMMDLDTRHGDNHWYIHDVPKLDLHQSNAPEGFEADLLDHLKALNTPAAFIQSIQGHYDYSTVKVHLVTSIPNMSSGTNAEKHGLLRLRRVIRDLDLNLPKLKADGVLTLHVCTASIGNLNVKWLSDFGSCIMGEDLTSTPTIPDMKIFFPTVEDVRSSHQAAQEGASNIGCHTRPWPEAPDSVKALFHHYKSKDHGYLFHQKLILAYKTRDTTGTQFPQYIYVGSANLSASAWGTLVDDTGKASNPAACNKKLRGTNFECGVVIPGDIIMSLLESKSQKWQEIIPFDQTTEQYKHWEKPWNGTLCSGS